MKLKMKKLVSLGLVSAMSLTMLAGCGNSNGATNDTGSSKNQESKAAGDVKIGVLVQDVSGEEALGFRAYYEDYVADQYGVTFTYTDELKDAASEKSAIEKFASQGYQAVISLSSNDRALQIETCEENQIYYAVAAGNIDDDQFEQYKSNECFLGQVGPSMQTEYEAGVDMGKFFADKGIKTAVIYGAFIPNPMHVYRVAGVLSGLGLAYDGSTEEDEVVGLWMIQSVRKEIVPDMSFGQICELASKEPIKSIVDVNDNRFLAPSNMTEEVKRACAESGQQVPDSIAQIAAVIYNSLAECYASTVKEIEGLTHKNYEYIHIVGGGANAGYLNELTANETRKTVYAGPTEATAIGNIASQMIADGKLKDLKDARRCIFDSFEIKEYNPDL